MNNIISSIIASMLPVSELRGGIPIAYLSGNGIILSFLICTFANLLVVPIGWLFLEEFNSLFLKIDSYNKFFNNQVATARRKMKKTVDKYGYLGLMIFIAIPLPLTGAYTGTLGAWALGMEKKKSIMYGILGVIIAGIIVSSTVYFGLTAFNFFIK